MATITCPSCRKKVSDVTAMCPYCGFRRGKMDAERMTELRRRGMRDDIYRLSMTSYLAIAFFLASFCWYWWESGGFMQLPSRGPVMLVAASSAAYLVIRVLLFRARRRLRQLG
jgi:hypothetical protein